MVFKNFSRTISSRVSHFAGNTLPNAIHRGATFFNNKLLPAVRLGHRLIKHATNEISQSEIMEPQHKQRAKTVAEFADLGLQKLNDVGVQADHIAQKYGKAHVRKLPDPPPAPV